jgi:fructose-bisphosphate aldolase class I
LANASTIDVANEEPNRQPIAMHGTTTPGAGEFVGGVILFDETLRQSTTDGKPFAELP